MAGLSAPRLAPTEILPQGIQSHGRSVLVWPDLVDDAGLAWLRFAVPLGVRVVVFGRLERCPVWPGPVQPVRLRVYRVSASGAGDAAATAAPSPDVAHAIQALHRTCGLTRLPAAVFRPHSGWWHRWVLLDGALTAAASGQLLDHPLGGWPSPPGLVCGVAAAPSGRRRGLGRLVVDELRAVTPVPHLTALVVADDHPSNGFFRAAGWEDSGDLAETAQWT